MDSPARRGSPHPDLSFGDTCTVGIVPTVVHVASVHRFGPPLVTGMLPRPACYLEILRQGEAHVPELEDQGYALDPVGGEPIRIELPFRPYSFLEAGDYAVTFGSPRGPDVDCCEVECSLVDGGGLVVSSGEAAPLFELVDASFDGVPLLVGGLAECWWPATSAAEALRIGDLVCGLWDDCTDPPLAQVFADRAGGIRLVRKDHRGPRSRSTARAGDTYPCHDLGKRGCIPSLARGEDEGERPAVAVSGKVDLCGQSATGTAEGMVRRACLLGPLLTGPSRVLVSSDDCGVDRNDPADILLGVSLGEQGSEDSAPRAIDRPAPQTVVGALPRSELGRKVRPRDASAVLERDRVDHLTVITPSATPPRHTVRQQRLNASPLGISQCHSVTTKAKAVGRCPIQPRSTTWRLTFDRQSPSPPCVKDSSRSSATSSW